MDTILIKKYPNRKFYDTSTHTYLNYMEIQQILRSGKLVRIVDNKSKEDQTRKHLLRLLFRSQQRQLEQYSDEQISKAVANGQTLIPLA